MNLNVRQTLKKATSGQHGEIEKNMNLMSPEMNRTRYKNLMARFAVFFNKIEEEIDHREDLPIELEWDKRKKCDLLARDLQLLGMRPANSNLPEEFQPPLKRLPEVLGALYVLEGSTLGGQMLAAHFTDKLSITSDTGGAYYNAYGSQTGAYWRKYIEVLESKITTEADLQLAVNAARKTFLCLSSWMVSTLDQFETDQQAIEDMTTQAP